MTKAGEVLGYVPRYSTEQIVDDATAFCEAGNEPTETKHAVLG